MRLFLDVERDTRNARGPAATVERTVHRSSLLVPELSGHRAVISFLNHFLIKRGIDEVACRITAVDANGKRINAKTLTVKEPRAYFVELAPLFPDSNPNSYIVEFFSARNLAIPYPAVMVNHFGNGTFNMVHAYNRVLNDVFEQDGDVSAMPAESSIDVRVDDEVDTFAIFASGPQAYRGDVVLELAGPSGRKQASVALDMPRLTQRAVGLKDVMPDLKVQNDGVLRIRAPSQFLFFGRMLAGQRAKSGAFSANHTYYDSGTTTPEYHRDNTASWIIHPYFPELTNTVRFYPFFSASRLRFSLMLQDRQGAEIHRAEIGELVSPSDDSLTFDINACIAGAGIDADAVSAFRMEAAPVKGNTPTRIPHQLVHGNGGLNASVVYGFHNKHVSPPQRGFIWGQLIAGEGFRSQLGVARSPAADRTENLMLQIYGERGKVHERPLEIPPGSGASLQLADLVPDAEEFERGEPTCLWYLLTGTKPDFYAHSIVADRHGNATAEHAF
jgi:hypothetical protein